MAALAASTGRVRQVQGEVARHSGATLPLWWLAWLLLALVVGLRFEVGGDWFNYFRYIWMVQSQSLGQVLAMSDPGYMLFNWLGVQSGWGIYMVNLLCALVFVAGLVVFCRAQPRPALALVIAIPYLVLVLGMGYTRQGVALGLGMIGLVSLVRGSTLWFVFWVVLAATFHKSAVLLIPVAALAASKNKYWTVAWVSVAALLAYAVLLEDEVEALYANYVLAEYQSQGALIRLLMNAVPAALFLLYRKRFRFSSEEHKLWLWISLISLLMLVLLAVSSSSTAVDRVALYFLPLQLVIFSRLPEVLGSWSKSNQSWVLLVIAYYGLVQFVWLNFANHAYAWLPYKFAPFQ
ncbi:EpsG family protein [Zobellella maritima]|uniref:EpsG family protein n=1 Tax=Zobellella maritima TaxID=2059725 RepID=UPI0022B7FBA5|nr:EpsG family protein [Zobellella maritima]